MVALRMAGPVVGARDGCARRGEAGAQIGVRQDLEGAFSDRRVRARVHQDAVAAHLDDVVRPAGIGGDQRQAGGGGFQERQAEGLVQAGLTKMPPRSRAWA